MANLYDITTEIEQLLDSNFEADEEIINYDTGEITTIADKLNELEMDFNQKIDNIACYIKNLKADVAAMKEEEQKLAKRRKVKENLIDNLMKYASSNLINMGYKKFETPRCALSFRKSDSIEIADGTELDEKYLNIKEVREPNKTILKEALKSGISIDGVSLVERLNLQVK